MPGRLLAQSSPECKTLVCGMDVLSEDHLGSGFGVSSLGKEHVITMKVLWNTIKSLDESLHSSLTQLSSKVDSVTELVSAQKNEVAQHEGRLQQLEGQMTEIEALKEAQVKESLGLWRKVKFLENQLRRNSLRFLGFSRCPLLGPVKLVKKYLVKVLGWAADSLPPVARVFLCLFPVLALATLAALRNSWT